MEPYCVQRGGVVLTEHPYDAGLLIPALVRPGRRYARAPIAEAIIELRCENAEDVAVEDLRGSVDSEEFPHAEPAFAIAIAGRIDVTNQGVTSETSGRQIGHVFRRADGLRIVQARLDRFSFSWLPPYEHWDNFAKEAERLWHRYREHARSKRVTRLGVRFINKIDVNSPSIEIKDYLRIAVDVPAYLPQGIVGYVLRIAVPLRPLFNATTTITSTLIPPPNEQSTSLILDIDTWELEDIDLVSRSASETIRSRLEMLRQAKNYVFESCITDATRGLIA